MGDEGAEGDLESTLQVNFRIVNKSQSCRIYKGVPLAPIPPQVTDSSSSAPSTTIYHFVYLQCMPRATPQRRHAPRPTPLARQTGDDLAHLGYGPEQCTNGFLAQFTETRIQKPPKRQQLTTQQHWALCQNADIVASIRLA